MASIKKRSDGTWQATIYCGRDENGKKINKYVTKHSEKEIKKAARELEQELEDGNLSNIENIRISEWIKSWLEIHKNKYSPSTYVLYLGYLKNHYPTWLYENDVLDHLAAERLGHTILKF